MLALQGCPYEVPAEMEARLLGQARDLESRVVLLRGEGITEEVLRRYYNNTRLVDVAESNAIEGSTLELRETELAVMKGVTLTGHDPAYARDARALFGAFERLADLARDKTPTNVDQVKEIHGLILGGRPGAGVFRSEPVTIRGARHRPPANWSAVMQSMEERSGPSAKHRSRHFSGPRSSTPGSRTSIHSSTATVARRGRSPHLSSCGPGTRR